MEKLAIIGSGISGLGCVHLLDGRYQITLFEKDAHFGGHANTVDVEEEGRALPVDTGFMVFNRVTYPNLCRLFARLEVAVKPTDMSFSVQHQPSGLEFAGSSVNHLFAQRRNLIIPDFWRLLWEINRFNGEAVQLLEQGAVETMSIGDFLEHGCYTDDFRDRYLVPMSSAVWSTPPDKMLDFPAATLIRFFHNHGFLGMHTQHPWLTPDGGSRNYVRKLLDRTTTTTHVSQAVRSVRRRADGVDLIFADGQTQAFDRVILASHADQSLALLEQPTATERELLGAFRFQLNRATLHTDESFMPRRRLAWSSWNYRVRFDERGDARPMTIYWMNRLQGVSDRRNYFVSINGADEVDPAHVVRSIDYEHPLFSLEAVRAQARLPELNRRDGDNRVFFCGAWFKYGFHEDGFTSAIECARALAGGEVWS